MPLLHVLILAFVQGITEFLPISSSGHLVLVWNLFDAFGWQVPEQLPSERLVLDAAVHVGTLFAVCVYFWRDLAHIGLGLGRLLVGQVTAGGRLGLLVLAASLPLLAVGYLFMDTIAAVLRDIELIAWTTIGFGALLLAADRGGLTVRRVEHLGLRGAMFIGLAQVLALVPGTSRSGITMTAARFLGLERPEAARFSLLLAIPAILGAGTLAGLDLQQSTNAHLGLDAVVAAGLAFVFAFLAIALLIRWLRRASFTPFVFYRFALGAALLLWIA